jgi:CheY-like chemotaxis protein
MIAVSDVDRSSAMNATKDIDNRTPMSPHYVASLPDHRNELLDDKVGIIPLGGRSNSPDVQPAKTEIEDKSKDGKSYNSEKPLPKCDPPTLRRHQSEPLIQQRRSIFGHYWNRESLKPKAHDCPRTSTTGTCCPPSIQRTRSMSIEIPEHVHSSPQKSPLQEHFSVPRNHRPAIGKHFSPIGDMMLELEKLLPALPTPLQRYFRDGKKALLGGAYPLNAPTSILRESSYRKFVESQSLPLQEAQDNASSMSPFNLTQTCRDALPRNEEEPRTEEETSSTSTSSSASRYRSVHFDPRITVTEYADVVERQWFSDEELEHFKCQTIALAQRYLVTQPEMMEEYSKARLDPVTGTFRKKALFSMPALSSTDETELPKLVHRTCVEKRDLAEREVKSILIVEPNTVVLDLFRRSLNAIFPKAKISVAENGEEALRMVQMAMPCRSRGAERGFDVVIAEEVLSRNRTETKAVTHGEKSDSNLDGLTSRQASQVVKDDSFSSLSQSCCCSGMSGSELFGEISEIEKTFDASQSQLQTEVTSLVPAPRRALLIGVSVHPDEDAPSFITNGADFVWGKPPPMVNGKLRNQIVSTLVKKRQVNQCSE